MIEVLVVDDSAVVRELMTALLSSAGDMRVTVAGDPLIAMQKMKSFRPDVVVLDLEMPRMDGLTFMRRLMAESPVPVVVCSGLARSGTEIALTALEEGAVDIITKPALGVSSFLQEQRASIVQTVRAAARARLRSRRPAASAERRAPMPALPVTTDKVVAIGASTGGTEALKAILESLPPDMPGIVIAQHMPEIFTRAFAERLDAGCAVDVAEAADGQRIRPGLALIAPGNRHLRVRRSGAHYITELGEDPPVSRHRPSVDVLFRSVARAAGSNAVGVILTGMGSDGAEGLLDMHIAGAHTIAQDEASCVVFGMPKEAIRLGAAQQVVSLSSVPEAIVRACSVR